MMEECKSHLTLYRDSYTDNDDEDICDCHVSGVRKICKYFFYIYIFMLLFLFLAIITYKYNKNIMQKAKQDT